MKFWEMGLLRIGSVVHVRTHINLSVLQGKERYLAYEKGGEMGVTHKAVVAPQEEEEILQSGQVKVEMIDTHGEKKEVSVGLESVMSLNAPTAYSRSALGHLVFEDSVTCNYSSGVMKVKLLECCSQLRPIIKKMDLASDTP